MQFASLLPCAGLAALSLFLVDDSQEKELPELGYDGSTIAMVDVADLEAGQRFYEDVLGLGRYFEVPEYGWAEMHLPTKSAKLGLSAVEKVERRASASFSLGVRDIEKVHAHLVAHDVEFVQEPYTIDGLVKLATFVDPWGNQVMLHQSLKPAGQ